MLIQESVIKCTIIVKSKIKVNLGGVPFLHRFWIWFTQSVDLQVNTMENKSKIDILYVNLKLNLYVKTKLSR